MGRGRETLGWTEKQRGSVIFAVGGGAGAVRAARGGARCQPALVGVCMCVRSAESRGRS